MSIRSVVYYPDAKLMRPAAKVEMFDDALRQLAADLLDTIRSVSGLGITAPHIGVLSRVVVLELPDSTAHPETSADASPSTYINPEIIWSSKETIVHDEGSISMPGIVEKVTRASRVRVLYQDLDGVQHEEEAEGFRAVCHQHEIDQLNGIFWIDRLSALKRERVTKRFKKMQRD